MENTNVPTAYEFNRIAFSYLAKRRATDTKGISITITTFTSLLKKKE